MLTTPKKEEISKPEVKEKDISSPPAIQLPKGGGAIKGIGEKFGANPVTGTGSMTVPIATSPGRSGFGPQLSLAYDSGAGNGSFGFGWSLSLPAITRKTDKGLPRYRDAEESDVFILSGSEDLVPVLKKDDKGNVVYDSQGKLTFDEQTLNGYQIRLYRPRIEGLFARIERWTELSTGEMHWRSFSRDNILTLYGRDENSRIVDPNNKTHIFSWLISETRDDKGNGMLYNYKAEDSVNVDLTQFNERNRGDANSTIRSTNRHIKKIYYGNVASLLVPDDKNQWKRPDFLTNTQNIQWLFEVVFDYGEHDLNNPTPNDTGTWFCRNDSFSSYQPGFEVRNYRLCQRVLMFHHFPDEKDVGQDCVVRSTDFVYRDSQTSTNGSTRGDPIASFIASVTQCGYKHLDATSYIKKNLPPLEFEYSDAVINEIIESIDPQSLENLPIGIDGKTYQWVDLFGEGVSGIFTEQGDGWYYKRNLSPGSINKSYDNSKNPVTLGPMETIGRRPAVSMAGGRAQFMDLAADGQPDLVMLDGLTPGFFEVREHEHWANFRPFKSKFNRSTADPNLKFIDLNGDGYVDVLVSEDQVFTWYPSLAKEGFGAPFRVSRPSDEEVGPAIVFSDPTQSIYLADMSGDGLSDIVRIRNGEVCYWPNLGYGQFGAKVTMDNNPWFDAPDMFDQRRIRIADIDGSGNIDIIYLANDGVHLYLNQSGNRWSEVHKLNNVPRIDNLVSVATVDLHGNGTACLVWSSPLPNNARQQMYYIDLMGGKKPHLLIKTVNNLGAETEVKYVSSTKFYVQDKQNGKPWITRLPFPVYVVETLETIDRISGNRFMTHYAYHHGYFDGVEREFRGFGMVEQWDGETFEIFKDPTTSSIDVNTITNNDEAYYVPQVYTKTWFHTGVYVGKERLSNFFSGLIQDKNRGEYYREPAWESDNVEAKKRLLNDTILPNTILKADGTSNPYSLSSDEEREACRALKGSMLRQEVYTLDGTDKEKTPYTVVEQNFTIACFQPQHTNQHSIFFTHAREAISYHYERDPTDPRVAHSLTLDVDPYGNVLHSASVVYGRLKQDSSLNLKCQVEQQQLYVTSVENHFTNNIDLDDSWRVCLPSESSNFEVTGLSLDSSDFRFNFDTLYKTLASAAEISYETLPNLSQVQKRLIEKSRTLYRSDDLLGPLPLRVLQARALPYESYKLAYTPGLINTIFVGKVTDSILKDEGRYVHVEGDQNWWIPSGRIFYSPKISDAFDAEYDCAKKNFFLPRRIQDPFGGTTRVNYDNYNLLLKETIDAIGNRVTVGEREHSNNSNDPQIDSVITQNGNDYRVLQPWFMMDPNRNRSAVCFDILGVVVGTAIMGKPEENEGDSLEGFNEDLSDNDIDNVINTLNSLVDPTIDPLTTNQKGILLGATSRIIYDFSMYQKTAATGSPKPNFVYTVTRETHHSSGTPSKLQHAINYSDGFGREIQKKGKIEAGPLVDNGPNVNPRWLGSGWVIYNNKGKPVKQYEPFFSSTYEFEFDKKIGVGSILFYDPIERVIATLHPNNTYEKVVFDPWSQVTYDVNDTVLLDPRVDPDIKGYMEKYFELQPSDWKTWLKERLPDLPDPNNQPPINKEKPEEAAAIKTLPHANTPTYAYFDTLGRAFLTLAHNGKINDKPLLYPTEIEFDIGGNQRSVIDALGREVMQYDYDMLGNKIKQVSMDAGTRWMFNDVAGKPARGWDSRQQEFIYQYDILQRPVLKKVTGGDGKTPLDNIYEKIIYGENQSLNGSNDQVLNLRGKVFAQYDTAGKIQFEAYDFKGNILKNYRQVIKDYKSVVDWNGDNLDLKLENEQFITETSYDALSHIMSIKNTTSSNQSIDLTEYSYNDAGLLEGVTVTQMGTSETYVKSIDYNEKNQRKKIVYGNGLTTNYAYDPNTFRLTHLRTYKTVDSPLQELNYTYDPVGNISQIEDRARPTIFFGNMETRPINTYSYDALYRLKAAEGREHAATLAANNQDNWENAPFLAQYSVGDPMSWRSYTQQYIYDPVGNINQVQHAANGASWTRDYVYETINNRLKSTKIGNIPYSYDHHPAHGFITKMPHLQVMAWNFKDELQAVSQQSASNGITPETTYYIYDGSGQRVRKITENQFNTNVSSGAVPTVKCDRIYLGNREVYREPSGSHTGLERWSLHVMDDKQRIAMIETRNEVDDGTAQYLVRYQYSNHLGTVSLETNESGRVISYEEYHPYGTTSYQAIDKDIKAAHKRYRYTGKERDEESGFNYHGARYYAPWLGRWISCDPIGIKDGLNLYVYVHGRPTIAGDPTGNIFVLFVLAVVAIATFTSSSEAGAPTNEKDARNTKPHVSDAEFAARTALTGTSMAVGGGVANALKGALPVTRAAVAGYVGGATRAIGNQVIEDAKKGEVSSAATYAEKAHEEGKTGAVIGGTLAMAGVVKSGISPTKPPADKPTRAPQATASTQPTVSTQSSTSSAAQEGVPTQPLSSGKEAGSEVTSAAKAPMKKTIEMRLHQGENPTTPAKVGDPVIVAADKHGSNYIRIMPGNPSASLEMHQKPYVHLRAEGKIIGKGGEILPKKGMPEAHIPFQDWSQWNQPYKP